MKVVVTGANGKIGREAVQSLKAAGHAVVTWDLAGPGPVVDCTDFGQVFGALSGIDILGGVPDAVLHLAGIPMPGKAADHVIFEANTLSTYSVMSACVRLGVWCGLRARPCSVCLSPRRPISCRWTRPIPIGRSGLIRCPS